jgi:sugar-specific transcriptional regulator TrmB
LSIESLLKDEFKLSLYEAKVYLALLKGKMLPKEIASISQVPLPRIYDTLQSLQTKGFAEQSGERFSAISLRAALRGRMTQFEMAFSKERSRREKAMADLLSILEDQRRVSTSSQDVTLLKGINAISNKFSEVLDNSKDVFFVIKRAIEAKELFKSYFGKSSQPPKRFRILLPESIKLSTEDRRFISQIGATVRQTENLFLDLMVADKETVMIGVPDPLSEEPFHSIAVVIKDGSFASSIHDSLEGIWRRARKY